MCGCWVIFVGLRLPSRPAVASVREQPKERAVNLPGARIIALGFVERLFSSSMGSDNGDKAALTTSKDAKGGVVPVVIFSSVPLFIGIGVAWCIYNFGATAKYEARVSEVVAKELHWAMAAICVLGRCVTLVNMLPMIWKQKIMTTTSGNLRSNLFIYTAVGDGAAPHQVLLETEGDVGKYNRANRSLHHMVENFAVVIAGIFAAAQVFPFPTFVATCLFSIGRVLHLIGYTYGYGKHAPGFVLSTISTSTIEGMLALVALKGFGLA